MPNFPRNIIVHHTAVSYKTDPQFEAVDNYHRDKGWGGIGYHYFIEKDGTVIQGREDTQVGAHTKQNLMNYRSIGICLSGNFDRELPTAKQKKSLYDLILKLQKEYNIPDSKVYPHRHFAPKSCWGRKLPDDILSYLNPIIQKQIKDQEKILERKMKIARKAVDEANVVKRGIHMLKGTKERLYTIIEET